MEGEGARAALVRFLLGAGYWKGTHVDGDDRALSSVF